MIVLGCTRRGPTTVFSLAFLVFNVIAISPFYCFITELYVIITQRYINFVIGITPGFKSKVGAKFKVVILVVILLHVSLRWCFMSCLVFRTLLPRFNIHVSFSELITSDEEDKAD